MLRWKNRITWIINKTRFNNWHNSLYIDRYIINNPYSSVRMGDRPRYMQILMQNKLSSNQYYKQYTYKKQQREYIIILIFTWQLATGVTNIARYTSKLKQHEFQDFCQTTNTEKYRKCWPTNWATLISCTVEWNSLESCQTAYVLANQLTIHTYSTQFTQGPMFLQEKVHYFLEIACHN